MPQQEKQSKVAAASNVGPSLSFLDKLLGAEPMTPNMVEGMNIARKEIPDLAPIETYGYLSRLTHPNTMGYASAGNTIYLDPRTNAGQTPQEIADTITHEMEHVKQNRNDGYGPTMRFLRDMFIPQNLPYAQRPDEMAAYQAEKQRRSRMGRMQSAMPSFEGGFYMPHDVNLPAPKNILVPK